MWLARSGSTEIAGSGGSSRSVRSGESAVGTLASALPTAAAKSVVRSPTVSAAEAIGIVRAKTPPSLPPLSTEFVHSHVPTTPGPVDGT